VSLGAILTLVQTLRPSLIITHAAAAGDADGNSNDGGGRAAGVGAIAFGCVVERYTRQSV